MSNEQFPPSQLFSQIDVSHQPPLPTKVDLAQAVGQLALHMRDMVAAQDRQNELLEELVGHMSAAQRQKAAELGMWKQANPDLSRNCRDAAAALTQIQTEYLSSLTDEINENFEILRDGEFMLNEFVDRFGPRMAHLNGIMQLLAQLGGPPERPAGPPSKPH